MTGHAYSQCRKNTGIYIRHFDGTRHFQSRKDAAVRTRFPAKLRGYTRGLYGTGTIAAGTQKPFRLSSAAPPLHSSAGLGIKASCHAAIAQLRPWAGESAFETYSTLLASR